MATSCPYCDEEIQIEIEDDWNGNYWSHHDDFICPKCGDKIEIVVVSVPIFYTYIKQRNEA